MLAARAKQHLQSGDRVSAVDLCREALGLDGNCSAAHDLLSRVALGGEDYLGLLQHVHGHYRPRTYLEIGVSAGGSIAYVGEETMAIGIDPAPRIASPLPSNIRIFKETSDEFFASRNLSAEFDGKPLDFAFLDGMHLFEYVLRDFINVERNSVPDTRVLIHDCYPLDEATSARERTTIFWTGDVWKLIVCLKKYRPDLRIHTLAVPPSGLVVVRGLDRNSDVLPARLDAICREFVPLPYSAIHSDKPAALNLVPGDWDTTRNVLGNGE